MTRVIETLKYSLTNNQILNDKQKTLLVHRKGSTRAFPPHHPLIPVDYQVFIILSMVQLLEYI